MAIENYSPPHSELYQQRESSATTTSDNNNVLVAGTQYDVQRYSSSTADSEGTDVATAVAASLISLPNLEPDAVLDAANTKLFARNVYKPIAPAMAATTVGTSRTTVTAPESGSGFQPTRTIKSGDSVIFEFATTTITRTVKSAKGKAVAQTIGALTPSLSGSSITSSSAVISFDTTYIIRVLTSSTCAVTDTAGKDSYLASYPADAVVLGTSGVIVNMGSSLTVGNVYTLTVTAPTYDTSGIYTLELTSSIPSSISGTATAELVESYTGEISSTDSAGDATFIVGTTAEDGIAIGSGLASQIVTDYTGISLGSLFVQTRGAIYPTSGETYLTLSSLSDINEQLGGYDRLNDLGYAVYYAMTTGGTKTVYAVRTAGDTADALTAALDKTKRTDLFYELAPTVDASASASVVKAHCEEMSESDIMRWRVGYLPVSSPGMYAVAADDGNGGSYTGQADDDVFTFDNLDLEANSIAEGDLLLVNFATVAGATTYDSYVIAEVLSANSLRTETSITGLPDGVSVKAEIWKDDSAENTTLYLENLAASVNSERIRLVWCDQPQILSGTSYVDQPMLAVSASMAGLRASVAQHKPLTNADVVAVTAAPAMYTRFTTAQLNRIASAGIWIITQDMTNGPVFVRHQLTSRTGDGILYREDSCVTNYDQVCYKLKPEITKYTGKRNNDAITLTLIRNGLRDVMLSESTTSDDDELGPPVTSFSDGQGNDSDVYVAVDSSSLDRNIAQINMELPAPNNGTILRTFASTWDGSTATIEA